MKKNYRAFWIMLILLFIAFTSIAQKKTMTWTTKSEKAKEFAIQGATHMMNIEFEQAYDDFKSALALDPDFTVVLVFMANLTTGNTKKEYGQRALKSAANKTEGEKLFASMANPDRKQEEDRQTWAKLHEMFPDGGMIGAYYVMSRATPEEQIAAAEGYIKKFPDNACMYNMMGYYTLSVKKDTLGAKKYFEKYIELYPDGSNSYDSMGEYYFVTGEMEKSEKYYNLALEKYPFSQSSVAKLKEIKDAKEKNGVNAKAAGN